MNIDLSDLLANKDFDQLTLAEQELVLSEISRAEYDAQREMIISAQILMANEAELLQPNPAIATAAIAALGKKKKGKVFALFTHKVPTWVAVAACVLVFFLFNYSHVFDQTIQNENTALVPTVDTVYVDKVVTEFRDIKAISQPSETLRTPPYSAEPIIETPAQIKLNNAPTYSDEMLNLEQVNYAALLQNHSQSPGVSLQNDSISQMINSTIY
jgi:hypothetical protein